MSESYDEADDTDLEDAAALDTAAADDLTALSAKYTGPEPNLIASGYKAAIERLKAQRAGLSTQEKISALLSGFSQPTRHGLRGAIVGASNELVKQGGVARKRDDSRDALIAKYLAEEPVKASAAQAAIDRIAATRTAAEERAKAAAGKPDSTAGVIPPMFPGADPVPYTKKWDPITKSWTFQKGSFGPAGSAPASNTPSAAPGAAPPGGNPFPVQRQTGAELAAKYHIDGLDPKQTYTINLAGADAGKVTPVDDTSDPLAEYGNLTGPALLDAMNPADRAQVELLAKGRVAPPTAGSRSKPALRVLALAGAAYPGVDFAKNYRTNIDFSTSGKAGQNIIKSGTAIDHAARLFDSVDALGNVDFGILSGPINAAKIALQAKSNPAIKPFLQNRDQFINELGAAIKGTGNATSLAEFKNWQKDFDAASTPTVLKAVIQRGVSLLGDRLQNQVQPYNDTLGSNRSFLSFLPANVARQYMRVVPDAALTDDDKAHLAEQRAARPKNAPATATKSGPSSAQGGKALPALSISQYKAIPEANKAAARAYLQKQGYDISGLN